MAYSFDPQIVARLLQGIGPALSAYGSGNSQFGQIGSQAFADFENQRRQAARDKIQTQLAESQLAQQQEAMAEQKRMRAAQEAAFRSFLPPVANPSGYRPTGAGPGASANTSMAQPSNPMLAGMSPDQAAFLRAYGSADPGGALSMIGTQAFKEPEPPKLPKMESYEVGSEKVSGYWDPKNPEQFVVMGKAPIKSGTEGTNVRWSLNPVYGQNDKGQTVLIVPNDQGGVKLADLPPGVTVAPQTQFVNTGTAQVPMDRRTGAPVVGAEPLPIDNSGKATQTDIGAAIAKAQQSLPALKDAVSNATAQIEAIKADPALDWATGWTGGVLQKIPGSSWKTLATRVDQLKGTSFLQARELLKGGGQITDYEGARADQAMARLDSAQSSEEFIKALDEFQTAINQGLARLQYAAQGNFERSGSEQFPMQTGSGPAVPSLYDKYGLTPPGAPQ